MAFLAAVLFAISVLVITFATIWIASNRHAIGSDLSTCGLCSGGCWTRGIAGTAFPSALPQEGAALINNCEDATLFDHDLTSLWQRATGSRS